LATPPPPLAAAGACFKYFRTPAVPTLRTVPPEVLLSVDNIQQNMSAPVVLEAPEPLSKTVATQSDYRDSEAQTARILKNTLYSGVSIVSVLGH